MLAGCCLLSSFKRLLIDRSHTFLGGVLGEELTGIVGCKAAEPSSSISSGRTAKGASVVTAIVERMSVGEDEVVETLLLRSEG
jgi:hypothetical protein